MGQNRAKIFDEGFASPAVTQRVWREVYGSEYPDGVEPYSHVTRSELARFCVDLAIDDKAHLVDIGCGRGGSGLWVAAHTGARLTGIDIAASALKASEDRARSLVLANRSQYLLGSFDALPLESNSADAVMSGDALLFAPDKRAAVVERRAFSGTRAAWSSRRGTTTPSLLAGRRRRRSSPTSASGWL